MMPWILSCMAGMMLSVESHAACAVIADSVNRCGGPSLEINYLCCKIIQDVSKAQDYRIDMLPLDIKSRFKKQFEEHIEWLRDRDPIQRAIGGFEAAIQFMMAQDKSHLLKDFWESVNDLDWSRNESLLSVVPELQEILQYRPPCKRSRRQSESIAR